jgi:hypothetical protein
MMTSNREEEICAVKETRLMSLRLARKARRPRQVRFASTYRMYLARRQPLDGPRSEFQGMYL